MSAAGQMHCLCFYSGSTAIFVILEVWINLNFNYRKANYSKRHAHSSTDNYLLFVFSLCLYSVRTGEIVAFSQSFCEFRINHLTSQVVGCQVALTGKNCTYCIVLGPMGSSQVGLKKPHTYTYMLPMKAFMVLAPSLTTYLLGYLRDFLYGKVCSLQKLHIANFYV